MYTFTLAKYDLAFASLIFAAGFVLMRGDSRWYRELAPYAISLVFASDLVGGLLIHAVSLLGGHGSVRLLLVALWIMPFGLLIIPYLPDAAEQSQSSLEKLKDSRRKSCFTDMVKRSLTRLAYVYRCLYMVRLGQFIFCEACSRDTSGVETASEKRFEYAKYFLIFNIRTQLLLNANRLLLTFKAHKEAHLSPSVLIGFHAAHYLFNLMLEWEPSALKRDRLSNRTGEETV